MMWRLLIAIFLVLCFAGANLSKIDNFSEEEFINLTEKMRYDNLNYTFNQEGNNKENPFLVRTIYKFADIIGFISVEGMRLSFIFGYYHPQYNFNLAWKLMFATMFAVLVIPTIYIVLFVGYGINQLVKIIKRKIKND